MQNTHLMIEEIKELIERNYEKADHPTLIYQCEKWRKMKPLQGLKLLDATPVFRNTLSKYVPLLEAGAELTIGLSSTMPYDYQTVEFLHKVGVKMVTPNDVCEQFDIILDCAAAFSRLTARVGYVELTRSGIDAYINCEKPVYVADSSLIKRIETSLGTGDGYFRAMAQLGYSDWKGKNLVVFGNGKVGHGIAIYGEQYGAKVTIFDENSPSEKVLKSIVEAYAVVTATGVKYAVQSYATELCGSKALLANMGVEDEYSEKVPVDRVLAAKRPLNFILDEPTHLRYIETTMALHNHGAVELLTASGKRGLIQPTAEIENELLEIVAKHGKIDTRKLDVSRQLIAL